MDVGMKEFLWKKIQLCKDCDPVTFSIATYGIFSLKPLQSSTVKTLQNIFVSGILR